MFLKQRSGAKFNWDD